MELIHAQEEERKQLALDLHDETGQLLSALQIGLDAIAQDAPESMPDKKGDMKRLVALSEQIFDRIRSLAYTLRPSILDRFGLLPAIQDLCEWVEDSSRIEVRVKAPEFDESRLPQDTKITLFRFIQEGLTNAVRHSRSQRVEVTLHPEDDCLRAIVLDFGGGFDVERILSGALGEKRLGLVGMTDRLKLSGGRLVINSGDQGTVLSAEVPLEGEA